MSRHNDSKEEKKELRRKQRKNGVVPIPKVQELIRDWYDDWAACLLEDDIARTQTSHTRVEAVLEDEQDVRRELMYKATVEIEVYMDEYLDIAIERTIKTEPKTTFDTSSIQLSTDGDMSTIPYQEEFTMGDIDTGEPLIDVFVSMPMSFGTVALVELE